MINKNYSIGNDLSYVKPGDLVFHTQYGYLEVYHSLENDESIILENGFLVVDKDGRDYGAADYPNVFPVVFESIIAAIGYITYYQHFMTNDRNLDPRMK